MPFRTLVVDRRFATDHHVENAVELLPAPDRDPPAWHLPFRNNSAYTREIVRAKDRLASLYASRLYAAKLPYRADAMESFYNALGYAITFLLGDRLLRINRLLGTVSATDMVVPLVRYSHDATISANDFLYRKVEADAYFNQWVVNSLLPDVPRVALGHVPTEVRGRETLYTSKLQRAATAVAGNWRSPGGLMRGAWGYLARKLTDGTLRERLLFEIVKHGRDLPCEFDAVQIANLHRKTMAPFWPWGRLGALRTQLSRGDSSSFSATVARADFAALESDVAAIFRELLRSAGEPIHLPETSLRATSSLIGELLPTVVVEEVPAQAERFLSEMSRFRGTYYVCGSTYSGYDQAFRTFAARQSGKKIMSTQHSAWGGYLADGALISELLIAGCDDYVTFGWDNKDPNVSNWRGRAVFQPSPLLSELRANAEMRERRRGTPLPARRNILLSTGFSYRFPAVYNSFLRVDTVYRWTQVISEVLEELSKEDVTITIIMYDRTVASLHRSSLDRWLAIHPTRIVEHPNHDTRVRRLMQAGTLQDEFDAIVWDMPAGGFSEAVFSKIPTFSLWTEELIKPLEPARPFVDDLLRAGVFFANGAELSRSIREFYRDPLWYWSQAVQRPVEAFTGRFLRADPCWDKSWQALFESL